MTRSLGAALTGSSLIITIWSPGISFPSEGPPGDRQERNTQMRIPVATHLKFLLPPWLIMSRWCFQQRQNSLTPGCSVGIYEDQVVPWLVRISRSGLEHLPFSKTSTARLMLLPALPTYIPFLLFCLYGCFVCTYVCTLYVYSTIKCQKTEYDAPRVIDRCEQLCGCWGSNLGLLQQ